MEISLIHEFDATIAQQVSGTLNKVLLFLIPLILSVFLNNLPLNAAK